MSKRFVFYCISLYVSFWIEGLTYNVQPDKDSMLAQGGTFSSKCKVGISEHLRAPNHRCIGEMVVVGLSGPSAAGKSTLLRELQQTVSVQVISCDDFYLPKDECPRFDLAGKDTIE